MIPAIGVMVGAYILLRCVEITARSREQFASNAGRTVVAVIAILVLLNTLGQMAALMTSSASVGGLTR